MRYGFKAQAERIALGARKELGLKPSSPLDPWIYANHLKVLVLDLNEIEIPPQSRKRLLHDDYQSWSGMTIRMDLATAIVINPSHSRGRQASTLAHELAHVILKHAPAQVTVSSTGLLLLSDYSDNDEEEADWLAAAVLLPRDILFEKRQHGKTTPQIAAEMGVSLELCEWRIRMTGVDLQIKRSSKRVKKG